jgi:NAD(P)-dependent dehydrogenase (short-subunit alcohol dehydrogenase family)
MATYTSSILVTGGTSNMGYHCALSLAKQRPQTLVVIASRTDPDNAAFTMNETLGQDNVVYMPLDLSSLAKVRGFVKRWEEAKNPPIQALVFNAAGQWPLAVDYTDDGIEKNFGVNHVGHALLFHLLVPHLLDDARIVIVASGVHDPDMKWGIVPAWTTPSEVAQPSHESAKNHSGMERYAASKLANTAWMLALATHLATNPSHGSKTVIAMDPGFMPGTGLYRNQPRVMRWLISTLLPNMIALLRVLYNKNTHTKEESAGNLAWLVISDEVSGKKGVYFEGRVEHKVGEVAGRKDVQEELWKWTVERIGETEEERMQFGRVE